MEIELLDLKISCEVMSDVSSKPASQPSLGQKLTSFFAVFLLLWPARPGLAWLASLQVWSKEPSQWPVSATFDPKTS